MTVIYFLVASYYSPDLRTLFSRNSYIFFAGLARKNTGTAASTASAAASHSTAAKPSTKAWRAASCASARSGGSCSKASSALPAKLIVPEQEDGTLEVARRGGFAPQIASRPGSLVAVLAQVSLGAGCAIVPQAVMAGIKLPGVCYRELAGPLIASEIAVAFRRHEQNSAARAWILQLRAAALP